MIKMSSNKVPKTHQKNIRRRAFSVVHPKCTRSAPERHLVEEGPRGRALSTRTWIPGVCGWWWLRLTLSRGTPKVEISQIAICLFRSLRVLGAARCRSVSLEEGGVGLSAAPSSILLSTAVLGQSQEGGALNPTHPPDFGC